MASSDVEEATPPLYTPSEIEKLGRERPEIFGSIWKEFAFGFSVLGSMFMAEYFISGFNILLPALSGALEIPREAETWPASVFSLVTGAFLLPASRLADMYGGCYVFSIGLGWLFVWTLIAGFSQNYIMLIVCRALQGFGPAAFLPTGIMLLGSIYRPGPRKNVVFSLYGAFAPFGFFGGIFFAGLTSQYLNWRWYFFLGSIMLGVVAVASWFGVPTTREEKKDVDIKMDWWGCATVVPALVLIVYAITDGTHASNGWSTPHIPVTFVLGCLLLIATVYIELRVAEQPLLPADVFSVKGMTGLTISLFFLYGNFGIFLFYASFYIEEVLHVSPLLTAAWFAPMCVGGLILATVGGFVLHLIPGSGLLLLSGICYIISVLLFAIMPEHPNYWAYVFPAMICATGGIDITYNITSIFITTSMPKARQGLAGALINSILFLGISFFLGMGDLAVSRTSDRGQRESYKVAFWLGVASAIVGAIVMFLGVKIGKAESGLTADEIVELERELTRRESHPT